ncbi:MAG: hypothetical protein ACRBBK_05275 [Paracoccaceae bacterium]
MSDVPVYLNGVGLCTSLGQNRETTQATYAAGKKKFFKDPKVIGQDGMPVTYAPVFNLHDVPDVRVRFQQLVAAVVADLTGQVPQMARSTQVIMHLPAWLREIGFGGELSHWPVLEEWSAMAPKVVWSDQTSFPKLLADCHGIVAATPAQDVVLIAADTFLWAQLLDQLALKKRTLSKSQPHGIIPSEAAVAFRLTTQERLNFETCIGWVDGHWQATEMQDVYAPKDMLGEALAEVVNAGATHATVERLLVDADGERWRSEELGMALARTSAISDELLADFETPPLLTGYSGAAMPAVLIALALGPGAIPVRPATQTERHLIVTSTLSGKRDGIGIVRDTRMEVSS